MEAAVAKSVARSKVPAVSRRGNGHVRCAKCYLHAGLCICDDFPHLELQTRLWLVTHRDEAIKTTNTGRLIAHSVQGARVLVHGRKGAPLAAPDWPPGYHPMILFPEKDSVVLTKEHATEGPVLLILPDGTWRQATKMRRRLPWLADLPAVRLPSCGPSQYRLRAEPKEGGLATAEAASRALGILEGKEVRQVLDDVFLKMVERTLYSRGLLDREDVHGGVPAGVQRHCPGTSREGFVPLVRPDGIATAKGGM